MVVREIKDGSTLLMTQEDHAELSVQFAAHWGNKEFAKLRPYESMIFATTYHDSGYREWEGCPPINMEKGRPYGHRETIPAFERVELEAYVKNIEWVRSHDRYAGLLVSMHRTGLWQNRYGTMSSGKSRNRGEERSQQVRAVIERLEAAQQQEKKSLGGGDARFEAELWFNYRLLQVYDILSLYFCINGYDQDRLTRQVITPVPVAYDTERAVDLEIIPNSEQVVKIVPYPFDCSPLKVSLRGRIVPIRDFTLAEECRETYFKARRVFFDFDISH